MARNAVTDTATGYVKRHGFCDFTTDGSFDPGTETQAAVADDTEPPAGVPLYHVKVAAGLFAEMAAGEKTAVDAALLEQFKREKAALFDLHTQEILARGVEHPAASGNFYDISPSAVSALEFQRDVAIYPFLVHAIGFTGIITINNATAANTLVAKAQEKLREVLQAGAVLLEAIRNAADKVALDAITDPRP